MTFLDVLKRRHNFKYFNLKECPKKEVIEEILKEALLITPIKNDVWHFEIEVFGPEHAEEKKKLCLRTLADMDVVDEYKKGGPKEKKIDELEKLYEEREEDFNVQVRAPYLLVYKLFPYKHSPNREEFGKKKKYKIDNNVAAIGAGMHGYAVSILANEKGIDASFCNCFFNNDFSSNYIMNVEKDFYFFLGLGYKDGGKHNFTLESYLRHKEKEKPNLDDVVRWK